MDDVGIVVIGRNEGERLRASLTSIGQGLRAAVYVDSGSTDGSVELARSLGFAVIELDVAAPFTAARARNAGLQKIATTWPAVRFVQVVDGDCEIAPDWVVTAQARLLAVPDIAVVFGRRREKFRNSSCYNLMCDDEWDGPPGPAASCGGDALLRLDAVLSVGGYNPALIAGEEPDLCLRLRQKGWRIERLPSEMTLHDAAIYRFRNWWRRAERSGHAFAELADMHAGAHPEWGRQLKSMAFWSAEALFSAVMLILGAAFSNPQMLVLGFVFGSLLLLQTVRIARRKRRHGLAPREAVQIAGLLMVGKLAEVQGAIRFYLRKLGGLPKHLIEYKNS